MFEGIIYCDIKCIIIFFIKKKGIVYIVIELKGEKCINEKKWNNIFRLDLEEVIVL